MPDRYVDVLPGIFDPRDNTYKGHYPNSGVAFLIRAHPYILINNREPVTYNYSRDVNYHMTYTRSCDFLKWFTDRDQTLCGILDKVSRLQLGEGEPYYIHDRYDNPSIRWDLEDGSYVTLVPESSKWESIETSELCQVTYHLPTDLWEDVWPYSAYWQEHGHAEFLIQTDKSPNVTYLLGHTHCSYHEIPQTLTKLKVTAQDFIDVYHLHPRKSEKNFLDTVMEAYPEMTLKGLKHATSDYVYDFPSKSFRRIAYMDAGGQELTIWQSDRDQTLGYQFDTRTKMEPNVQHAIEINHLLAPLELRVEVDYKTWTIEGSVPNDAGQRQVLMNRLMEADQVIQTYMENVRTMQKELEVAEVVILSEHTQFFTPHVTATKVDVSDLDQLQALTR